MNKTVTLGVIMFSSLLVVIVALLLLFADEGKVNTFLGFVLTIIPVTIGVLWTSNQNDKIRDDVAGVHQKVNGELDAKFQNLNDKIDNLVGKPVPPPIVETEPLPEGDV